MNDLTTRIGPTTSSEAEVMLPIAGQGEREVVPWWEDAATGPPPSKRPRSRKSPQQTRESTHSKGREPDQSSINQAQSGSGDAPPTIKPSRAPGTRAKPKKSVVTLLETATVGLALAGLIAGYFAWRLSIGTISISALTPTVEDALDKVIGGHTDVGSLRLGFDPKRGDLLVFASDITASRTQGGSPLQLGAVDLTLDPLALMRGQARVTEANFRGVQAILVFDQSGATSIGFGTIAEALAQPRRRGEGKALRRVIEVVRENLAPEGRGGALEALSLKDAGVTVVNADTRDMIRFTGASARVARQPTQLITLQIIGETPDLGGQLNLAIAADFKGDQPIAAALDLKDVNPGQVGANFLTGQLAQVRQLKAPVTAQARAVLDEDGTILRLSSRFSLGSGMIGGQPLTMAEGNLAWSGANNPFSLKDLNINSKMLTLTGGQIELAPMGQGRRSVSASAERLDVRQSSNQRLSGTKLQLNARTRSDQTLDDASLTFSELGATQGSTQIKSQNGQATIKLQPNQLGYSLTVSSPQTTMGNKTISLDLRQTDSLIANLDLPPLDLENIRRFKPETAKVELQTKINGGELGVGGDRYQLSGLNVSAQGIASNGRPRNLDVSLDRMTAIGGARGQGQAIAVSLKQAPNGSVATSGQVRSVDLTGQLGLALGAGTIGGRLIGGQGGQASSAKLLASDLVFDIGYSPNGSASRRSMLRADRLDLSLGRVGFQSENLAFEGNLGRRGFSDGILRADQATVADEARLDRPFQVQDLRYAGDLDLERARIEAAAFHHRGVDIKGAGSILFSKRGSGKVDIDADVDGELSVETLFAAWPRTFLAETRTDLVRIVRSGTARTKAVKLRIPKGVLKGQAVPQNAVEIDFEVANASANYLDGMTPLTGIYGRGRLEGNSFLLEADRAKMGGLDVSDVVLDLSRFQPKGGLARLTARVQGEGNSMLHEIDRPPLRLLSNGNFDPDRIAGQGWVQLDLSWPLLRRPPADAFDVKAGGAFTNASMTRVLGDLNATRGDVTLSVEDKMVRVEGKAEVANSEFDFAWTLNANGQNNQKEAHDILPGTMLLLADAQIEAENLSALGIDVAPYVTGSIGTSIRAVSDQNRFTGGVISANLAQSVITIPGRAWSKPVGVPASASAQIVLGETDRATLQNILFDTQGAFARGTIDLDQDMNISAARFSRLVIDNMADLSLDYVDKPDAVNVRISGPFLNLAPFLAKRDVTEKAVDLFNRPLGLDAQIDRVQTDTNSSLTRVQASIMRDAYGWRSLRSVATDPMGVSQISLDQLADGRRTISGTLKDAGLYARLLYAGAPIFGGAAKIEGELPVVGAATSGSLLFEATNVTYGQPTAAQYQFDTISLPMKVQGGVISFQDGKAMGSSMTVKGAGYVDVEDGAVDIRGLATPGGLNRLFGELPVFGGVLGSRQDEGLVGMTLAVKGTLEKPVLQVNPISALAPGFLRRIFEAAAPLPPTPKFDPARVAPTTRVVAVYGPSED